MIGLLSRSSLPRLLCICRAVHYGLKCWCFRSQIHHRPFACFPVMDIMHMSRASQQDALPQTSV